MLVDLCKFKPKSGIMTSMTGFDPKIHLEFQNLTP